MEKDRIFKTTLRLYRDNSNHQKALKCLEDYNKDIFKNSLITILQKQLFIIVTI